MEEYKIITFDDYEKLVVDFLRYIEKETDIQFEYDIAGGCNEMVSIETSNQNSPIIRPAEVYDVQSYNYCTGFFIYVCESERRKEIIELALLPFNRETDETYIQVTEKLKEILPNIPISSQLRKRESSCVS